MVPCGVALSLVPTLSYDQYLSAAVIQQVIPEEKYRKNHLIWSVPALDMVSSFDLLQLLLYTDLGLGS